jgi:two-component system LytT family sensor kinase
LGIASRGRFGTKADLATVAALHAASLAAAPLRAGLSAQAARQSIPHLHTLLRVPALAIAAGGEVLAWDGPGERRHAGPACEQCDEVVASGRTRMLGPSQLDCGRWACPIRYGVLTPLTVHQRIVGVLCVYTRSPSARLVVAAGEVARWVSEQLEVAPSATRPWHAESTSADLSPHFTYNALTAITSFVRTDPDRANDLLHEFADFARYAYGRHTEPSTLAEELGCVESYLALEQARFSGRIVLTSDVPPAMLPLAVPHLSLQMLVEDAVRRGVKATSGPVRITILARDVDADVLISVADEEAGQRAEPTGPNLARHAAAYSEATLSALDWRLRQIFGRPYGLIVQTFPGDGQRVSMRVPNLITELSSEFPGRSS